MAFLRNRNREHYTVIDNYAINDDELSLKALGLLVKLLSLPDNWQFSENGLEGIFKKDKQASIRSGLKELETYGYLKRYKVRDSKGRIIKTEWEISETPYLGNPQVENPHLENPSVDNPNLDNPNLENPHLENQPQLNTNIPITKETKTKGLNTNGASSTTKRFSPPSVEDVREYCLERHNNIDPEYFVDYYASKGWLVGKTAMKDWKAAVRNWERRDKEQQKQPKQTSTYGSECYTFEDGFETSNPFKAMAHEEGFL